MDMISILSEIIAPAAGVGLGQGHLSSILHLDTHIGACIYNINYHSMRMLIQSSQLNSTWGRNTGPQ